MMSTARRHVNIACRWNPEGTKIMFVHSSRFADKEGIMKKYEIYRRDFVGTAAFAV